MNTRRSCAVDENGFCASFRPSGARMGRALQSAATSTAEALEARCLLTAVSWLGGTGNWNDPTNWSTNRVPGAGDDVSITVDRSIVNITDTERANTLNTVLGTMLNLSGGALRVDAGGAIASNSFNVDNSTITVQSGNLLVTSPTSLQNTTAVVAANSALTLDQGGDRLRITGTFTGSGAGHVVFNSGQGSSLNPDTGTQLTTSVLNFPAGMAQIIGTTFRQDFGIQTVNAGFLQFIGDNTHPAIDLKNQGTITVSGLGSLGFGNQTAFVNDTTGVINLTSDAGLTYVEDGNGGSLSVTNNGLIKKTGGTGTSVVGNINFQNVNGRFDIATGTISLTSSTFLQNTTVNTGAGAALSLDEGQGNGDLRISGTFTGTGTGHVLFNSGQGSSRNPDTGTQLTTSILNFPAGMAQVTGTTFRQAFGVQTVNTGFLQFVGDNAHPAIDLTNQGTITVSGLGNLGFGNQTAFVNDTAGVINLTSDAGLAYVDDGNGGSLNVVNKGLIKKTGGAGISVIGAINLQNLGGNVEVDTGTIDLQGGGDTVYTAGSITAAPGSTFSIDVGTGRFFTSGTFAVTGGGKVNFASGNWDGPNSGYGQDTSKPTKLDFAPNTFFVTGGLFNDSTNLINTGTIIYSGPNAIGGIINQGTALFPDSGPYESALDFINDTTGVANFAADTTITVGYHGFFENRGKILKSGGTGTLDLSAGPAAGFSTGMLINTGVIESASGTIKLPSLGSNLSAGQTLQADAGATITTLDNGITSNAGTIVLNGAGASIPAVAGLTSNTGTFAVLSAASFTTAGTLANSGTVSVGGNLTVTGNFTETGTSTLNFAVAGAPGTAAAPGFAVHGTTTLAGNLTAGFANGFAAVSGAYTAATFSSAASGTFGDTSGVGPAFTASVTTTTIVLNATGSGGGGGGASDLGVTAVSAPSTFAAGQNGTVHYTVINNGPNASAGTWTDSIYLSTDATLNASAIALGQVVHTGPLASGASYTGTLAAPFPATAAGTYHVIVVTDSAQIVPDTSRADNTGASTALTATVPTLSVGGSVTATPAAGKDALYQLTVPGGQDVRVTLTYANPLTFGLLISREALPISGAADFSSAPSLTSTSDGITILHPQAGTYYIRVTPLAQSGGNSFTLRADTVGLSVFAASPGNVGQGLTTFTLDGAGYAADDTVTLRQGGTALSATNVSILSANRISASFDLSAAALGVYDLRVTSGSTSATLSQAVTVAANSALQPVTYNLDAPATVRPQRTNTLYVQYTNPNNVDIPAPLFLISEPNMSFRLAGGNVGATVAADTGFYQGQLFLLGINQEGVANMLPGHYSGRFTIEFKTLVDAGDATFNPTLSTPLNLADPASTFDLANLITPGGGGISPLTARILAAQIDGLSALPTDPSLGGATGYSYSPDLQVSDLALTQTLEKDTEILSVAGTHEADAYRLIAYSLQQADQYGLVTARQQSGAFGQGTPDPLHYALVTMADGSKQFVAPNSARAFAPNSSGAYIAVNPLDLGTLTRQPDDTFRLTEPTGDFYQFNSSGLLDYVQRAAGQKAQFTYDANGRVTSISGSNGSFTNYSYDPTLGVVVSATNADGITTTFGYRSDADPADPSRHVELLTSITTPSGTTTIDYSPTPREQSATVPVAGGSVTKNYLDLSPALAYLPISITYAGGAGKRIEYDAFGRPTRQTEPDGSAPITFAYDATGLKVVTTFADGSTNTTLLGLSGAPLSVTDGVGGTTVYGYSADGLLTSLVGPAAGTATTIIESAAGPTAYTNAAGATTRIAYNAADLITSVTDGNGNTIQFGRDSANRLNSYTFADGTTTAYAYDNQGNTATVTDRAGHVLSITRDPRGRITGENFSDGTTHAYAYDSAGDLLTATGPEGTTTYTYDAAHRVVGISYPGGRTTSYAYDAQNRLLQVSDQTGIITGYAYDSIGRLTKLIDNTGATVVSYVYNSAGQLSSKIFANGTRTNYTYDARGLTTSIINLASNASVASSLTYTYNILGLQTSVTDQGGAVTTYGYDASGQLTRVALPGGRTITYAYDAAGNRTRSTDTGGSTTNYSVNNLNEYTSAGSTSYTYDPNGDMVTATTGGNTTTYTYDGNHRLLSSTGSAGVFTYNYNALGQLISFTRNGTRTDLVNDNHGNVIAAYDAAGNIIARYRYGIDLESQITAGGASRYYNSDFVGSTTSITDAGGAVVNTYSYLPFGEKRSSTGPAGELFTYVGAAGLLDVGDGLYQTPYRTYSPVLGRFLQPDPSTLNGFETNVYQYADNIPTIQIDSTGLQPSIGGGGGRPITPPGGGGGPNFGDGRGGRNGTGNGTNGNGNGNGTGTSGNGTNGTGGNGNGGPGGGSGESGPGNDGGNGSAPNGNSESTDFDNEARNDAIAFAIAHEALKALARARNSANMENTAHLFDRTVIDPIRDVFPTIKFPKIVDPTILNVPITRPTKPIVPASKIINIIRYIIHQLVSGDPNAIVGPTGSGSAGYIGVGREMTYAVSFENKPVASAAAQEVVVTTQLDPNVDVSTFELTDMGFGSEVISVPAGLQSFNTRVSYVQPNTGAALLVDVSATLDPSTRIVTWTFKTLDPTTLDFPPDAATGFLPPDDATGRGAGYVGYIVKQTPSLATGATINAAASIVFDTNAAIATNTWLNTIDSVAPTSSVTPLPANQTSNVIPLTWSGQDDTGGSGVATYTIYASIDGGAFAPWLTNTTATSGVYIGQPGHTYAFNSIATDGAGNMQPTPGTAQATTTEAAISRTITFGGKTKAVYTDSLGRVVTITLSGVGSGTLGFNADGNADPLSLVLTGTAASSNLTVKVAGGGTTTLSGIQITGSLKAFNAPKTDLAGTFDITGTLGSLILNNVNSGASTITIEAAGLTTIRLGTVHDLSIVDAGTIKSLTAFAWTNSIFASDSLSAIAVNKVAVKGGFDPSLTLSSTGLALGTLTAGSITGGAWSIAGSSKSISTMGGVASWTANFGGSLFTLHVKGDLSGSLSAQAIKTLTAASITGSTINLAGAGVSLTSMTVAGSLTNSQVRTAGSIGKVSVGGATSSNLYAGVGGGITALPQAADFTAPATIVSFTAKGKAPFADTFIGASSIGTASLSNVTTSNGGTPFGISTRSLRAFALRQAGQKPFSWNPKQPVSKLSTLPGDLVVEIV